ncbi:hypothetical protein KSP35_09835 [Aquihabitans sp. G128]|nr:hypothetical protein [Aquihabitans sp. G128]QXC63045.1 hypothetical protein KSP35_09835 [Aquihabitans sp. G128]
MATSGSDGVPPVDEHARWPRPVPRIGDPTSAAERRADPAAWAFAPEARRALRRRAVPA